MKKILKIGRTEISDGDKIYWTVESENRFSADYMDYYSNLPVVEVTCTGEGPIRSETEPINGFLPRGEIVCCFAFYPNGIDAEQII